MPGLVPGIFVFGAVQSAPGYAPKSTDRLIEQGVDAWSMREALVGSP